MCPSKTPRIITRKRKKSPPKQYRFHPKIPGETHEIEPLLLGNNSVAQKNRTPLLQFDPKRAASPSPVMHISSFKTKGQFPVCIPTGFNASYASTIAGKSHRFL
jgi:hypothetical protein